MPKTVNPKIEMSKKLQKVMGKKNIHEVPEVVSVTISTGIGKHKEDKGNIEKITAQFSQITGQHAKINKSRKAVSAFKLRAGQTVGLSCTLRGKRMYDFIIKLANVALPRVRDFRGIKMSSFDKSGNISVPITEHTIIPEIKYEEAGEPFGFQVNIKTSAKTDEEAKVLLTNLGFPFEKQ